MGSPEVGGGECRDCHDVLGFVWLYLDHEAPPTTCAELEAHLLECESCQRAVRFDRRFKDGARLHLGPQEPASSRATATTATPLMCLRRSSCRNRRHSRSCAAHERARVSAETCC